MDLSRPFGWIVNQQRLFPVDGLKGIMLQGESLTDVFKELAILYGFAVGLLGLASMTVRRT